VRRLVLPLTHTSEDSSSDVLQQLVANCTPATFGQGDRDVLDTNYRKARKIDASNFVTSFHPADFGIIENIEQILLPIISSDNELHVRRLTAELYKLNVRSLTLLLTLLLTIKCTKIYSGPSGLFRKHVDTPRSTRQIGSLVVCLPSAFKGGNLFVRHNGQEIDFDWQTKSASEIQWAAFYSDCEHEIGKTTDGDRITLTYNLYFTEPMGGCIPPMSIVDVKTFPLYRVFMEELIKPTFMKEG
jgi:hypothetical protein